MDNILFAAPGPWFLEIAAFVWWGLVLLAHIGFAVAVAVHARSRATALVPPWLWTVATLVCGPLVGVGYWFVNSSAPVVVSPGRVRLRNKPMQPASAPSGARG